MRKCLSTPVRSLVLNRTRMLFQRKSVRHARDRHNGLSSITGCVELFRRKSACLDLVSRSAFRRKKIDLYHS